MFQVGKIVLGETKPTWKIPFELIKQSERINDLIKEIDQLKSDKAELAGASNHVLDEIWDRCDCFTEAQQALHNLIAKHTEK